MANQRVAGLIQLQTNGQVLRAKGVFTWNLGKPKREPVVGSDGVHGYKEAPQVAFIEGAITDAGDIDTTDLVTFRDGTVNLKTGNGKMIVLNLAWYAGEGTGNTEEGETGVRWEGQSAEEVSV